MKRVSLGLALIAIIAVATWAYNVNYKTRQTFDRLDDLRADLVAEREVLQVLRVEWAWLNAPDRLQKLVELHQDELKLTRLEPDRFSFVSTVPFPPNITLDQKVLAELANISGATEAELEAFKQLSPQPLANSPLSATPVPPVRPVGWRRP